MNKKKKIKDPKNKNLNLKHPTHLKIFSKFTLLLLVFLSYFFYLSFSYDFATGALVSLITWSAFVLCTPIADAGILLDFPIRLLFGIKMFVTEGIVWGIAILLNLIFLFFNPQVYETTILTSFFFKIITNPIPYGAIIVLCAVGTMLSVLFGDELMNVISHKDRKFYHKHGFKHEVITVACAMIFIVIFYEYLIIKLGVAAVF